MVAYLGHLGHLFPLCPVNYIDEQPWRAHFFSVIKYKLPILFQHFVILQLRKYIFREKTFSATGDASNVHKQHRKLQVSDYYKKTISAHFDVWIQISRAWLPN